MFEPALPGNPRHGTAASVFITLSLQKLPKTQNAFLACCCIPPAGGNAHRLPTISTGCLGDYRPYIQCRSAFHTAGRQKVPAEDSFDCNSRQTVHGGILSICKHGQCFLSCMKLKEAMTLGSWAIDYASWCMMA